MGIKNRALIFGLTCVTNREYRNGPHGALRAKFRLLAAYDFGVVWLKFFWTESAFEMKRT
jgi:hypothetical protein